MKIKDRIFHKKIEGIDGLAEKLLSELAKGNGNAVISPTCLYEALAMVADVSATSTRVELMDLLGSPQEIADTVLSISNITAPRYGCKDFHYSTGASLWLDNSIELNPKLPEHNFIVPVEIEQVDLASKESSEAIGKWLSENTGGLFANAPDVSPETLILGLCAMHLKDSWSSEFDEGSPHVFTRDDGTKITFDFMMDWYDYNLLETEGSLTLSKRLTSDCHMLVSLPPEGVPLNKYVAKGEAWANMRSFLEGNCTDVARECKVYMPKFDISSDGINLKRTLADMGIKHMFEPSADFKPLSPDALMVSDIIQSTKLKIDEEGLEGASYVEILYCGGLTPEDPPKPREIYVDRPFVVAVVSPENLPLFVGLVRTPEE